MKLSSLFSIIALLIATNSFSQASDQDLTHFFDDGGISGSKNIVKLNIASVVTGDYAISIERVIRSNWSLEAGVGKLASYYNPDLYEYFQDDLEDIQLTNPEGGYSYTISPKYYYLDDAPFEAYTAFEYRHRHFKYRNATSIYVNDYTFNYGFQFILYQKLMMDINWGLGFRFKRLEKDNYQEETNNITMPLNVKMGYLF